MADRPNYMDFIEAMNGRPVKHRPDPSAEVEEIRRKLRRQSAVKPPAPAAPEAILYRRDLPQSGKAPAAAPAPAGRPVSLEEAVAGTEVPCPRGGKAYLVTHRLVDVDGRPQPLVETFRERFEHADSALLSRLAERCGIGALRPEDVVLVDLETCGLSNAPMFLVGALAWEEECLVVRQFLARDYSEERAITGLFADYSAGKQLVVSFNGKSFDLPYVRTRAAATGVPFQEPPAHFDLLHEARRVWRPRVPDCKLQTLERVICGRRRYGDIPGAEIPDAYHAYVRTANAAQIARIIEHNRLDLITLAELMVRLPALE